MRKVILLRSYYGDSRVEKLAEIISKDYSVEIFYWNREKIDIPPFADKINRIFFNYKAPYYSASLIPKLIIWNIWLFFRLLLSNSDIIIATDLDTAFPAKVVASVRNKKFVYDIADLYRDILPLNYPGFIKKTVWALERWIINRSNLLILPDKYRIPQISGAKPQKTIFIYNTPVLSIEDSQNKSEIEGFIKERFCVVYFGSLNNQRSILEMMQIVAEHPQDICMIVGGVGPLLGEVNRIAAANPERIKFLGKVEYSEVLSISNKADILFSIYNPEIPNNKFASPNKIFEAMYLGKPIIVSKNTTMMRYVEDMNIGIGVTYGNISEILAAVNRCMSMSTSEKMIQKRNNKQAYEKYSAKTMQSELLGALNLI